MALKDRSITPITQLDSIVISEMQMIGRVFQSLSTVLLILERYFEIFIDSTDLIKDNSGRLNEA